ncbi:MAG: 30S ribosomal protein S12 methylthiotransferase RimO [Treponema sp.]|nr:30S ribosomal protein S12 methylthiotransferase RimO [Treponema sp.]
MDPFGCVKNQVDAENMMSLLNTEGWVCSQEAEDADLIIVNSCGFIESAKQESIDAVLEWRKTCPGKKILLAGCLAQRYEKELKESLPEADGFFGVAVTGITEAAGKIFNHKPAGSSVVRKNPGDRPLLSLPGSAYVKISEGCNNNCSYCAIPLIRGRLKSRSIPEIVKECRALLARGIKELCIIGQDIGAFGKDRQGAASLSDLLKEISKLKGHFWVRLLYIHPDHFPLKILDLMEKDQRFLPYFDIPFQHSSGKILAAMNRRGNAEQYLKLIQTIRARLPHAVIRSTFLLGFPGETEEDFAMLLDFQQKAQLDWLGCFAYSREEDTPAFSMKGQVPKSTAAARKQKIEERQVPITEKNMDRFTGQKRVILIEEHIEGGKDSETFYLGRLYCHAPEIDGSAVMVGTDINGTKPQLGTLVPCRVIARRGFDLEVKEIE